MKRKAIIEETRIIQQANEKLPPEERSISKVKGLYRTAAKEVEQDRIYNPEMYMYMSDEDLSEQIKQKFDEKIADLPSVKPATEEKPEETENAEENFAAEMDKMAMPEEPGIGGEMGSEMGEMSGGKTESEPGADADTTEDAELDAFFGSPEGEKAPETGKKEKEGKDTEAKETGLEDLESGSDEKPKEAEEPPADKMNKE